MTLSVTVHRRDPETGDLVQEPDDQPGATLAGFESWRQVVYGSPAIKDRGARLLPHLESNDLFIEGADLAELRMEVRRLLADVEVIAIETGTDFEMLRFRLANLLKAADRAEAIGGIVWIS